MKLTMLTSCYPEAAMLLLVAVNTLTLVTYAKYEIHKTMMLLYADCVLLLCCGPSGLVV